MNSSLRRESDLATARGNCQSLLVDLATVWEVPWLSREAVVQFSSRLVRSLGRCQPVRRNIHLAMYLAIPELSSLLSEVVCHEAAHIVACVQSGGKARPHGCEWHALMEKAGHEARVRLPRCELLSVLAGPVVRYYHEHGCPVCTSVSSEHRSSRSLRCRNCMVKGLDDLLSIINHHPD